MNGAWPIGGGECGALIRARRWAQTPLGPVEQWSPALRATVANILHSPVAQVLTWGPERIMLYNDAYRPIAAARHPAAMGSAVATIFPDLWPQGRPIFEAAWRGETIAHRDRPIVFDRGDGVSETMHLDLFYTPVHDGDAGIGGVMCTIVDNSARVAAERLLAERGAELRTVTDAVPMMISFLDRDLVFRFANRHYQHWFGKSPDEVVGRPASEVIGPGNFAQRLPFMRRALAGETISSDATIVDEEGVARRVDVRYLPLTGEDGAVAGFHVLVIDVEERERRAAALAASNNRFRTAMAAVHGVLWTTAPDGNMLGEQPGWTALTGQGEEEYRRFGWLAAIHPDDIAHTVATSNAARDRRETFAYEHRVRRRDGAWRSFAVRAVPILGEDGAIVEWVGVHTDITDQRAAEATLRQLNETLEARVASEIAERRQAEAALAQAQRMETIGQLTGGVAHDFNNLLQVVSGNLQLLARDVAGDARAERRVANALAGVTRGARLASQLLAFGRRQPLAPKVVDPSRFVHGMDDMLRRAIGDGVEVETMVEPGLWNTFVDPGQAENALLNLAINARDAMDGQGRLTIELGNAQLDEDYARRHDEVAPGDYVRLAVSDTGSGIDRAVIGRVFEPFFSTKTEGKGSGLGLSMVYGFVKQSGGHVAIYSEVGEGTTIKLYLPRARGREDVEAVADAAPVEGGSETVLVVEDDAEVRETVVALLTDLGYRVLTAVDAAAGLAVIEGGAAIDLLFTDVVMPGALKSPDMARRARARLPRLAVLFTSGYTENAIVHGGRLDAGVELLSKPYGREALARKIRSVLADQRRRDGG